MRVTTASLGKVLVVRLEDGDVLHECVEEAALSAGIRRAAVLLVGGADEGSTVVVGPAEGRSETIEAMEHVLDAVHEAAGVGMLFPDESGRPLLHMHAAFGRGDHAHAGCVRRGVRTWILGEVVIIELANCTASRRRDPDTGFDMLEVKPTPPDSAPVKLSGAAADRLQRPLATRWRGR